MKAERYIKKPEQFDLVYKTGVTQANKYLVIKAAPSSLTLTRYGFSVSKRIGTSVVRNKIKRLLREIMRKAPLVEGWDIVMIARQPSASAGFNELENSVNRLLSIVGVLGKKNEELSSGSD